MVIINNIFSLATAIKPRVFYCVIIICLRSIILLYTSFLYVGHSYAVLLTFEQFKNNINIFIEIKHFQFDSIKIYGLIFIYNVLRSL